MVLGAPPLVGIGLSLNSPIRLAILLRRLACATHPAAMIPIRRELLIDASALACHYPTASPVNQPQT